MGSANPSRNCRQCGGALEADSHAGLCPQCLVQLGIAFQAAAGSVPEASSVVLGPDESLPRRFGDYELLERIAQGGMGLVYQARQVSLNRIVALKMILAGELASRQTVLRFRAEAQAAANLHHPNIVAIYETGEAEGQHYFSMEYVAGADLGRLTAAGPLPSRGAARYLEKIAQAVEYAHQHGVLHRDLKPSNVLIDEDDEPRVTDFGLAKRFTADSDLTLSGQLLGSPNFIPPEQASSQRGKVSRRSDVYGLGALMYHVLTGRPPFQAATLGEILQQVLTQEPVSPRALNPGVPRDLETICLKCLEKEPSRRYPTAQAVAEELGRFRRGEPIRARPISPPERLWRWCRRNPSLAGLGAVVNVLLVALAVGGLTVARQQREAAGRFQGLAERFQGLAETNRVLLYASELKAAQQAIEEGNMTNAVLFLDRHIPAPDQEDLREFTWRYLNRQCQPYRDTPFLDHGIDVIWLATARRGQWLAAGGGTDLVTIWDITSGAQLQPPGFGTGEPVVTGPLAFSPDGRYLLASGFGANSGTNGVQIWETKMWRRILCWNAVANLCDFSSDGRFLAIPVAKEVLVVRVGGNWDVVRRLADHTEWVASARFSPDGRKLVTASADHTVRVWNVVTGACLGVFTNHTDAAMAAVFSPDSEWIASAAADKTVRLWRADFLQATNHYVHDVATTSSLDFSPDSNRWLVASGGHDGLVKVWDVRANTIRTLRGHSARVGSVRFVAGGAKLASGSQDHTVKLWDLSEPPADDVLDGGGPATALAFAPANRLLATVSSNGTEILLWEVATGQPARTPAGVFTNRLVPPANLGSFFSPAEAAIPDSATVTDRRFDDLAFSLDGLLAAACRFSIVTAATTNESRRVELWDIREGLLKDSFAGQRPVCFSTQGSLLAYRDAQRGTTILFRDLKAGRVWSAEEEMLQTTPNLGLAFSPDAKLLASTGLETRLWDVETGQLRKLLSSITDRPVHRVQPPLYTAAFTPDGELLLASGERAEIRFWEMSNLDQAPRQLRGHLETVYSLTVSPDGKTLATGDLNGLIKLWRLGRTDGSSGTVWDIRELLTLRGHQGSVESLRFSPDGNILASGSTDGTVRLWRAKPEL